MKMRKCPGLEFHSHSDSQTKIQVNTRNKHSHPLQTINKTVWKGGKSDYEYMENC